MWLKMCLNTQKNSWKRQRYKGILADGSQLFLCEDCGCENTIEKREQE